MLHLVGDLFEQKNSLDLTVCWIRQHDL